jgi:hypothetical protein
MNPFTYRYLDVPNSHKIQEELTKFILPYCENKPTGLWSVDLLKFFANCSDTVQYLINLNVLTKLKKVCYIIVHPGSGEKDAHVDRNIEPPASFGTDTNGCLSLNFGIQNCTETPVIFYEYLTGPKDYVPLPDPSEGSYIFYARSTLKEIDRYILDAPIIMNNTVPHAIYNNIDKIRISVSFRFSTDPWNLTQINQ